MLSTFHMGLQIECRCNIRGCFTGELRRACRAYQHPVGWGAGESVLSREDASKQGYIWPSFHTLTSTVDICWHPLCGESAGLSLKYHSRESCRGIVPSAAKFPLFSWRRSAGRCTNFNQTPQNHETILSATERGPTIVIHMMGYNSYIFILFYNYPQ